MLDRIDTDEIFDVLLVEKCAGFCFSDLRLMIGLMLILKADRLPYILFSCLPLFSKIPPSKSKVPLPYSLHLSFSSSFRLSFPLLPARLHVLHRLFDRLFSFETGFCLLIACSSARFPV